MDMWLPIHGGIKVKQRKQKWLLIAKMNFVIIIYICQKTEYC